MPVDDIRLVIVAVLFGVILAFLLPRVTDDSGPVVASALLGLGAGIVAWLYAASVEGESARWGETAVSLVFGCGAALASYPMFRRFFKPNS